MTSPKGETYHEQDVQHLFRAIRKGKGHLTRFMLAASNNTLLNCWDKDGKTPLIECCYIREEGTRDHMIRILKEAGADVNMKDKNGKTALIHACEQRCNDIVRILIQHANISPDIEDIDGNTALIHAANIGNDIALELLVRHFRRLGLNVDHYNKAGYTALHVATRNDFLQCAKILAIKGKASLTLKDKVHQLTPLEWCLKEGYQKSEVEFLKPSAKFYRVAKLTTTMAKYRKKSTQESSLSSQSTLQTPEKTKPEEKTKSTEKSSKSKVKNLLRKTKTRSSDETEIISVGAGCLPSQKSTEKHSNSKSSSGSPTRTRKILGKSPRQRSFSQSDQKEEKKVSHKAKAGLPHSHSQPSNASGQLSAAANSNGRLAESEKVTLPDEFGECDTDDIETFDVDLHCYAGGPLSKGVDTPSDDSAYYVAGGVYCGESTTSGSETPRASEEGSRLRGEGGAYSSSSPSYGDDIPPYDGTAYIYRHGTPYYHPTTPSYQESEASMAGSELGSEEVRSPCSYEDISDSEEEVEQTSRRTDTGRKYNSDKQPVGRVLENSKRRLKPVSPGEESDKDLNLFSPQTDIVEIDKVTEGRAKEKSHKRPKPASPGEESDKDLDLFSPQTEIMDIDKVTVGRSQKKSHRRPKPMSPGDESDKDLDLFSPQTEIVDIDKVTAGRAQESSKRRLKPSSPAGESDKDLDLFSPQTEIEEIDKLTGLPSIVENQKIVNKPKNTARSTKAATRSQLPRTDMKQRARSKQPESNSDDDRNMESPMTEIELVENVSRPTNLSGSAQVRQSNLVPNQTVKPSATRQANLPAINQNTRRPPSGDGRAVESPETDVEYLPYGQAAEEQARRGHKVTRAQSDVEPGRGSNSKQDRDSATPQTDIEYLDLQTPPADASSRSREGKIASEGEADDVDDDKAAEYKTTVRRSLHCLSDNVMRLVDQAASAGFVVESKHDTEGQDVVNEVGDNIKVSYHGDNGRSSSKDTTLVTLENELSSLQVEPADEVVEGKRPVVDGNSDSDSKQTNNLTSNYIRDGLLACNEDIKPGNIGHFVNSKDFSTSYRVK